MLAQERSSSARVAFYQPRFIRVSFFFFSADDLRRITDARVFFILLCLSQIVRTPGGKIAALL